jgi:predicted enzyme related to lactoylglutathione lyase
LSGLRSPRTLLGAGSSVAELDYTLVETGGTGGINGGIMKPKRGPWPAKLALYIDVDDLDAYGKKLKQAGGKIIVERQEVPGVGQFSLFEDPTAGCSGCGSRRNRIGARLGEEQEPEERR